MIVVVAGLVALLSPALFGGRLTRLGEVRLRSRRYVLAALLMQVVILSLVLVVDARVLAAFHVLSYLLAGVFVWRNRGIPGLAVTATGVASNGITIAVNEGTLPASPAGLRAAGIVQNGADFVNSGALAHPRLAWLGDVFVVPAPLPLANVFSIGDVLIVVGVAIGAHRICRSRLTRRPDPSAASSAPTEPSISTW